MRGRIAIALLVATTISIPSFGQTDRQKHSSELETMAIFEKSSSVGDIWFGVSHGFGNPTLTLSESTRDKYYGEPGQHVGLTVRYRLRTNTDLRFGFFAVKEDFRASSKKIRVKSSEAVFHISQDLVRSDESGLFFLFGSSWKTIKRFNVSWSERGDFYTDPNGDVHGFEAENFLLGQIGFGVRGFDLIEVVVIFTPYQVIANDRGEDWGTTVEYTSTEMRLTVYLKG